MACVCVCVCVCVLNGALFTSATSPAKCAVAWKFAVLSSELRHDAITENMKS